MLSITIFYRFIYILHRLIRITTEKYPRKTCCILYYKTHKGRAFNTDWKNKLQIYILSCGEAERFSVSNPR